MTSFPRRYWFEIDDQPWFPPFLRGCVQNVLLLAWNLRVPIVQSSSAAAEAADILVEQLPEASGYSFVDLCAGAGGPTPTIEKQVNFRLRSNGHAPAMFYLTDLYPHIDSWRTLSQQSKNISYIERPVDASDANDLTPKSTKECRIFNLAFHHFDDPLAGKIVKNAMRSADAFAIFELQDRTIASLLNVTMSMLGTVLITPIFYWRSPVHMFFTLIVPIIPVVMIFDGYVSSFRTRTPAEICALIDKQDDLNASDWIFRHGKRRILWPVGYLHWFVGVKQR